MSIINDALKKAQKNLSENKDKSILKPQFASHKSNISTEQLSTLEPKEHNKIKIIIILSLFIIVLFLSIMLFLMLNNKNTDNIKEPHSKDIAKSQPYKIQSTKNNEGKNILKNSSQLIKTNTPKKQIEITDKVTTFTYEYQRPLVLNGIIKIDDKHAALINGDDYEEGDIIYGMKIIKISSKHVEIRTNDGKIIRLNVRGK